MPYFMSLLLNHAVILFGVERFACTLPDPRVSDTAACRKFKNISVMINGETFLVEHNIAAAMMPLSGERRGDFPLSVPGPGKTVGAFFFLHFPHRYWL